MNSTPKSLWPLFRDPVEAMEFAKQIIAGKQDTDEQALLEIALLKTNPKWTRIAAIYALGFVGSRDGSVPRLRCILQDDDPHVRDHAREALFTIDGPQLSVIP